VWKVLRTVFVTLEHGWHQERLSKELLPAIQTLQWSKLPWVKKRSICKYLVKIKLKMIGCVRQTSKGK
jgi:hypothetical protein